MPTYPHDSRTTQDPSPVFTASTQPLASGSSVLREKLGLALAGGGFRATLFHVGVLRYLAAADLLRYVEVLSTVSGGSLVGALYVMRLKDALERKAEPDALPTRTSPEQSDSAHLHGEPQTLPHVELSRDEYIKLVNELERTIRDVVSKNLRMRLLLNPLRLLLGWMGGGGLAAAFSGWLDAHLFQRRWSEQHTLHHLRLCADVVIKHGGTENYNRTALWTNPAAPGSAVTRLIVNTTCLNSGGRFWFSHAEFGDWYLGYVRLSDVRTELWPRKWLLQEARGQLPTDAAQIGELLQRLIREHAKEFSSPAQSIGGDMSKDPCNAASLLRIWPLLRWWRGEPVRLDSEEWEIGGCIQSRLESAKAGLDLPGNGIAGFASAESQSEAHVQELANLFRKVDIGLLRRLKNFAWLIRKGRVAPIPVKDGMSEEALATSFVDALKGMDDRWVVWLGLTAGGEALFQAPRSSAQEIRKLALWAEALLDLVIEIYQFRCAVFMSPHVHREWRGQPLSDVVAASAAFPPVFPPHVMTNLVDDRTVRRLGLTDGGVFDNLGTTALLDEQCTMVIASDPGGLFDTGVREVAVGRLGLMGRLVELLGERPNQLFRHELRERRRMGEALSGSPNLSGSAKEFLQYRALKSLSTFRIVRTRDVGNEESRGRLLADIRTDLDVFGRIEQDALIIEGERRAAQHVERRFGKHGGGPLAHWLAASARPRQDLSNQPAHIPPIEPREHWVLRMARFRFLRLFRLYPAWAVAAAVPALAAAWAGAMPLEVHGTLARITGTPDALARGMAPCFRDWVGALPWLWQRLGPWLPALVLVGVGTAGVVQKSRFDGRLAALERQAPDRWQARWRSVASHGPTALKWMRAGFSALLLPLVLPFLLPGTWWPWLALPLLFAALLTVMALLAVYLVTPLYLLATRRRL